MKKTVLRLLSLLLCLSCLLPLSGCSLEQLTIPGLYIPAPVAALPEGLSTALDPLAGGVINSDQGFTKTVPACFTDEEIEQAAQQLLSAGILTEEELASLSLDSAVSRAMFIRLTVGAASGGPVSAKKSSLPGETWYSPYVQKGYSLNLFPDGGTALSFLPADGFFLGDDGYPPMLEPVSREDARLILSEASSDPDILLPLADGQFYGDGHLSVGSALVCAARVLSSPSKGEPIEGLPLDQLILKGSVVHAGGYIYTSDGRRRSYTNSAESLINAYCLGSRIIEVDFSTTVDDHLICVHGWQAQFSSSIIEGVPMPLSDWLDLKIYNAFSPLFLESLANFMRQHPDLYILTDVKDDNVGAAAMIARTCPDLRDRFLIQIYKDEEYEPVSSLGFSHIIYTLYNLPVRMKKDTDHWVEFAAEHTLLGYTYPQEYLSVDGYTEAMLKTGIPLFVHTLNNLNDIQAAYDAGITAVYTDRPEPLRED